MQKNAGLSFIELTIGLIIISILLVFSTPLMLALSKKNQIEVLKNELSSALGFARTTATLQDRTLVLQPLNEVESWSKGAILFVDNNKHQMEEGTKILRQWEWKTKGLRVTWKGMRAKPYLIFSSHLRQAALSGHFTIEDGKGKLLKLTINRLGRVRTESCRPEESE